jgi:site-specific DNA-methyltransferase (adenine-specific)
VSRVETIGDATLYLGDCRDILPTLGPVAAVITDPPYGIDYDPTRSQSSAASGFRRKQTKIVGDAEAFDPTHLLGLADRAVIWGANHFASRLPDKGGWLVWDKRDGGSVFRGFKMSDSELAWCTRGKMVRTFSFRWCGHLRDGERDLFVHPTQKSTALMEWCLDQAEVSAGEVVLDPYMGSGTTGVACVNTGRKFIGCEIDPEHFSTACRRIAKAYEQPRLFDEPAPKPVQPSLLGDVA